MTSKSSKKQKLINILKPHQKQIINYAIDNNNKIDRIFLFHSLGSGKTITSISLAFIYKILNNIEDKIVIVSPLSIMQNFTKEIKFLSLDQNLFEIHSYGRFLRKIQQESNYLKNKIVILDEIHNYRSNNKGTNELIKATFPAKKVILLSATPIVNSVEDFSTIIAILNNCLLYTSDAADEC
jgi:SNF2 family DNA or RNA helicase